jgi:hypothetical protein
MFPKGSRRYWDSSCFIAILNNEDDGPTCERILADAKEGKLELIVSPLTMLEVIRPKGQPLPIPRDKEQIIRDFFENDYVIMRNIDRLIAEKGRDLCWTHQLKPRDALHLATALETACECLETKDPDLLRHSLALGNPPIEIRKPRWTGQLPLLTANP